MEHSDNQRNSNQQFIEREKFFKSSSRIISDRNRESNNCLIRNTSLHCNKQFNQNILRPTPKKKQNLNHSGTLINSFSTKILFY